MHSKDLRILLEKALGFPVWNDLWDYLDELGFVKEVLDEAADINYLTDRANKVLSVSGSGSRREAPRMLSRRKGISTSDTSSDSESLRTRAVSILLAQEAAEEMQVQSFRREILEEKLLVLEEVSEWMKTQAKADGPETKWLYVQVDYNDDESIRIKPLSGRELFMLPPPGSDGVVVGEGTSNEMDIRVLTINYLEYSVPGIPWPQLQPIASGGVLYRLWLLVANLSARYSWTGAQATMFILTGLYPEVRGIRILEVIPRQRDARITLMIDLRVPPREVADEYQRLRREMVSGRRRSLSDKHLRLAAFVAECPQSDSWEEKMRGWNETYAESKFDGYRYTHRSNFIRDALKAQQHLHQPEYDFHKWREEGLIETDRVMMGDGPEFANPTS